MKIALALSAVGALLLPGSVLAQSHQRSGIFFQAGGFVSVERLTFFSGGSTFIFPISPPLKGGTVGGGSAAVGIFLSPAVSLRAEAALGSSLQQHYEFSDPSVARSIGGDAQVIFGPTRGGTGSGTVGNRTNDVYVTGAWHHGRPDGRVRVAYVGGVVFRRHDRNTDSVVSYQSSSQVIVGGRAVLMPITETQEIDSRFVSYSNGVVVGIDAEFVLSSHLTAVPQLRVVGATGDLSLRPGVSIRWH